MLPLICTTRCCSVVPQATPGDRITKGGQRPGALSPPSRGTPGIERASHEHRRQADRTPETGKAASGAKTRKALCLAGSVVTPLAIVTISRIQGRNSIEKQGKHGMPRGGRGTRDDRMDHETWLASLLTSLFTATRERIWMNRGVRHSGRTASQG